MTDVFIIDDDSAFRAALEDSLRTLGYAVSAHPDGASALEALRTESPACILCDLKLPKMSGVELIPEFKKLVPDSPIIIMTAYASVQTAVEAMKKGALDYIIKPFPIEQLEVFVKKAVELHSLMDENERLRAQIVGAVEHRFIAGSSAVMRGIEDQLKRVATSNSTVLITGESGSGKEVAARVIQDNSPRKDKPFLCVNCAALSAGLLESELFGHEKGAFTGADRPRKGRFELADKGTILLDEISEMDLPLQSKLLRVLQEHTFEKVGSSVPRTVDVRIIATTNRNLEEAIAANKFRQDLFYRLNVLPIRLPALREHAEDIPVLARYYAESLARKLGVKPRVFGKEALGLLSSYSWPGNVRELINIIERLYLMSTGDSGQFEAKELSGWLVDPARKAARSEVKTMEEMELDAIENALAQFGNNRQKAADALGISERTLREKLKKIIPKQG